MSRDFLYYRMLAYKKERNNLYCFETRVYIKKTFDITISFRRRSTIINRCHIWGTYYQVVHLPRSRDRRLRAKRTRDRAEERRLQASHSDCRVGHPTRGRTHAHISLQSIHPRSWPLHSTETLLPSTQKTYFTIPATFNTMPLFADVELLNDDYRALCPRQYSVKSGDSQPPSNYLIIGSVRFGLVLRYVITGMISILYTCEIRANSGGELSNANEIWLTGSPTPFSWKFSRYRPFPNRLWN